MRRTITVKVGDSVQVLNNVESIKRLNIGLWLILPHGRAFPEDAEISGWDDDDGE